MQPMMVPGQADSVRRLNGSYSKVAEIKGRTPETPLDSGFWMVFGGGSCFDIFWHLVTCFDSWTFFLSLSFVPRLSFCTGRSWPKGGLGSNVKKTSRQEDSISIPHKFRIRDVPQMPHIFCIFLGSHISIHIKFCIFLTLFLGNEMALLRWVLPVPAHNPVVLAWKRPDLRRHKTSSTTKIMKIHETIWISSRFLTFRVWKIGFLANSECALSTYCRFWLQVMILGRNSRSQAAPVRVREPWKGQRLVAAAAVSVEKGRVDTSIHETKKSIQPLATCGISHVPPLPHTGTECSLFICRQLVCESSQFSWLFLFQDCSFDGFTCTHWSSKFPLSSRGMGHHLDMTPEFGVPSRWHWWVKATLLHGSFAN